MSIKCQDWVYEYSEATGNDRLVLLAIADEADDNGTNAHPGIDRISHKARVPKRTTMSCLARLEAKGYLVVHRPKVRGRGRFNSYEVIMELQRISGPWSTGPTDLTPTRRLAFIAATEDKVCAYCEGAGDDEKGPDGASWQVDRVVPGAKGGTYALSNMVLSCEDCNRRKKDQDIVTFKAKKHAGSAPIGRNQTTPCQTDELVQERRETARNGATPYLIGSRPPDPLTHNPLPDGSEEISDETPPDLRAGVELETQEPPTPDLLAAIAAAAPPACRYQLLDDPEQAPGRAALRHRLDALAAAIGPEAAVAVVAGEWPAAVASPMAHANARARAALAGSPSPASWKPAAADPLDGIAAAGRAIAERARAEREAEEAESGPIEPATWRGDLANLRHKLRPVDAEVSS